MDIERFGKPNGHTRPSHDNSTCCCSNQESSDLHSSKTGLTDYSPKDKPWNKHRSDVDAVSGMYAQAAEFEKLSGRMDECSGWLGFNEQINTETGEIYYRLKLAHFCRVRYCPVCQWRRSLMWKARFMKALPKIVEEFPKSRWLFLTLTVRNCEIEDLGDTLTLMNKAWNKFIKRKDLKPVQGWIRTTEVTRGKDRSAHPHFHCLMMVPPSWFTGKYYVKQSRFIELWRDSLQANYDPNVDVRVAKPKKGSQKTLQQMSAIEMLSSTVAETLKYSTKPDDMVTDKQWFFELTRQTHKKRFMATGGALKGIFKVNEETNEDLIHGDDDDGINQDEDGRLVRFHWDKPRKEYHKKNSS